MYKRTNYGYIFTEEQQEVLHNWYEDLINERENGAIGKELKVQKECLKKAFNKFLDCKESNIQRVLQRIEQLIYKAFVKRLNKEIVNTYVEFILKKTNKNKMVENLKQLRYLAVDITKYCIENDICIYSYDIYEIIKYKLNILEKICYEEHKTNIIGELKKISTDLNIEDDNPLVEICSTMTIKIDYLIKLETYTYYDNDSNEEYNRLFMFIDKIFEGKFKEIVDKANNEI